VDKDLVVSADLKRRLHELGLRRWAVAASVLLGATLLGALLGARPSVLWLALPVLGAGLVLLLQQPILGLLVLVPAALLVPFEIGTGSEVALNAATLLVPAVLALWALDMVRRQELRLVPSRTNRPLALFLAAGLLSLLIGNATWDPAVPRSGSFIIVQLAQWALLFFSAAAFWLTGNLIRDKAWLRRLTFLYLAVAGCLAILRVLPPSRELAVQVGTIAVDRSPFWMLLAAVAGGQLLFNRELSAGWRVFLLAIVGAVLFYALVLEQETASNWVGVAAAAGVLAWLRFPRWRKYVIAVGLVLAASGLGISGIYEFAGGESEWDESGGSRLALIERVIEVTMRNPVTGIGPASYRPYARTKPLPYMRALWMEPLVSSHNNYVDLFAHGGLLGLALFFWFATELARLGFRVRARFRAGFAAGYANAMLAAWAGSLALMLFADWILPFVYNIGFSGFQASVLVWLFLGGLLALEQMAGKEGQALINGNTGR
jgi:hypothetical protein